MAWIKVFNNNGEKITQQNNPKKGTMSPSLRIGRRRAVPFVGKLFQVQREPIEPIEYNARKKTMVLFSGIKINNFKKQNKLALKLYNWI